MENKLFKRPNSTDSYQSSEKTLQNCSYVKVIFRKFGLDNQKMV